MLASPPSGRSRRESLFHSRVDIGLKRLSCRLVLARDWGRGHGLGSASRVGWVRRSGVVRGLAALLFYDCRLYFHNAGWKISRGGRTNTVLPPNIFGKTVGGRKQWNLGDPSLCIKPSPRVKLAVKALDPLYLLIILHFGSVNPFCLLVGIEVSVSEMGVLLRFSRCPVVFRALEMGKVGR
jgi:hypothetical protein